MFPSNMPGHVPALPTYPIELPAGRAFEAANTFSDADALFMIHAAPCLIRTVLIGAFVP
jgi:hypothetical protein